MTDLTEKWRKGELPSGWYYYGIHNETDVIGCDKLKMYRNRRDIKDDIEVLAEVPDYVEWRNMVNCACEEHETNHRLLEENAQLKENIHSMLFTDNVIQERYDKAKQDIGKLKELLKEVFIAINEGSYFDQCDILKKIDEVQDE